MSNWTEATEDIDEPIPLFAKLTLPNGLVYELVPKGEETNYDAKWQRRVRNETNKSSSTPA